MKRDQWSEKVKEHLIGWINGQYRSYFDIRKYLSTGGKIKIFFQDENFPAYDNSVAIAVTFNPDDAVLENLKKLKSQFRFIVIIDNSPVSAVGKIKSAFASLDGISFLENQNRNGLAGALNLGVKQVYASQLSGWIFWFDQDSEIHPDFLQKISKALQQISLDYRRNSLFGVNYEDGKTAPQKFSESVIKINTVITSGSFTRVENLNRLGLCVDEFFIDSIDHEYCLRAQRNGMDVRYITTPVMKHSLGAIEMRTLLWKRNIIVTNHSPMRWYYFARNFIFTSVEGLPSSFAWTIEHGYSLFKNFIKMLFLEQNKLKKVTAVVSGSISGVLLLFGIDRRY
jgi:rhamnosyltransferase